jgi:hypothetical protein
MVKSTDVTNKQITDAIEAGITDATNRNIHDWMAATDEILDLFIENGQPFSSGEIAAHLRTFRPDLRFSVTSSVGEHIRERFWACSLPLYEHDDMSTTPVEQVSRVTQGFTRTPLGTQVFVYGPDQQTCLDHEFEVEIPAPGVQVPADPTDAHGLPAKPVQAPQPVQGFVSLKPQQPKRDLVATIHSDGRCYIPRSAFEAFLHETQTTLRGGDSVFVLVEGDEARINMDSDDGAQIYQLTTMRGRIRFPHPTSPFKPGNSYRITVDAANKRLLVDLSTTL